MTDQPLTRHQRWELRKQEKDRLRGTQQRQQQIRRTTKIVVRSVLAIAIVAGLWYMISSRSEGSVDTADLVKVQAGDWVKGSSSAQVVLIEYADFQCPACAAYHPLIKQAAEEYGDKVAFVYRQFPLTTLHRNAMAASIAAEAAGAQGKFFEMHDLLFSQQSDWENSTDASEMFAQYAVDLGLDATAFNTAINDGATRDAVEADMASGRRLNVNGTPTFFLNGRQIPNFRNYVELKTLVDAALLTAPVEPIPTATSTEAIHLHADFKVYLNNKAVDFTQAKYQSDEDHEHHPDTHLHDGNGDMLHVHAKGITMAYFLKTIGITFTPDCLTMDTGTAYCSNDQSRLKFYVNGVLRTDPETYVITDLDRILISYGADAPAVIEQQIKSITDVACIYSEVCPERGTPPTENCVGGLGSKC